jgi:predicted Zn-ribbon and HTH transcriptional regulator
LIALLVAVLSTKKEEIQSEFLHCKRCGFEFSETHVSCPACRKEGINVLVNETIKQQVSLK